MLKNKISIIGGAGHIGLPLSIKFSEKKFIVNIIDVNLKNLGLIQKCKPPFKEIGLKKKLSQQLKTGRIIFSKNLSSIRDSKNIILCIGTPINKNFKPDLKNFNQVIRQIKNHIKESQSLIVRSSVIPGTNNKIYNILKKKCSNLAYCPERIVEGKSFEELPKIPQIISGSNKKTIQQTVKLFKNITNKIIVCDFIQAELSKVFSNLYRYINFAIPNEMYLISKKFGVDFSKIREIMIKDYPRNKGLAKAGFVGGPCLMKDSMQMSYLYGIKKSLVNSAYNVNENLPNEIIKKIKQLKIKNKKVGVLGLTFKPDSDDLRGSLSASLLKKLKKNKFNCYFSDPYVNLKGNLKTNDLIKKCNIIVIGSNHKQYKKLKIKKSKTIIDLSGLLIKL
tara:strand:+ start:1449 stop:2624 length:1176 start_codon:yes stop_codon:yes gene_type:complete